MGGEYPLGLDGVEHAPAMLLARRALDGIFLFAFSVILGHSCLLSGFFYFLLFLLFFFMFKFRRAHPLSEG